MSTTLVLRKVAEPGNKQAMIVLGLGLESHTWATSRAQNAGVVDSNVHFLAIYFDETLAQCGLSALIAGQTAINAGVEVALCSQFVSCVDSRVVERIVSP